MMKRAMAAVALVGLLSCEPSLPSDLPGLMRAMGDYDMEVSWYAARKVRDLYGKEGLFQALKYPNEYTRSNAAHWLVHYSGPDVEQALVVAATDPDARVRMWAAWSLGEQGSAAVLPTLQQLSGDPKEVVRLGATEAIRKAQARTTR
jgi:hypothetical protein